MKFFMLKRLENENVRMFLVMFLFFRAVFLKPGFQVCWIHAVFLTFASPVTSMLSAMTPNTPASANKASPVTESAIAMVCHLFLLQYINMINVPQCTNKC